MPEPALYRHFSGKVESLAVALADAADGIANATQDTLSHPSPDKAEALRSLVRAYAAVALIDLTSERVPALLMAPIS